MAAPLTPARARARKRANGGTAPWLRARLKKWDEQLLRLESELFGSTSTLVGFEEEGGGSSSATATARAMPSPNACGLRQHPASPSRRQWRVEGEQQRRLQRLIGQPPPPLPSACVAVGNATQLVQRFYRLEDDLAMMWEGDRGAADRGDEHSERTGALGRVAALLSQHCDYVTTYDEQSCAVRGFVEERYSKSPWRGLAMALGKTRSNTAAEAKAREGGGKDATTTAITTGAAASAELQGGADESQSEPPAQDVEQQEGTEEPQSYQHQMWGISFVRSPAGRTPSSSRPQAGSLPSVPSPGRRGAQPMTPKVPAGLDEMRLIVQVEHRRWETRPADDDTAPSPPCGEDASADSGQVRASDDFSFFRSLAPVRHILLRPAWTAGMSWDKVQQRQPVPPGVQSWGAAWSASEQLMAVRPMLCRGQAVVVCLSAAVEPVLAVATSAVDGALAPVAPRVRQIMRQRVYDGLLARRHARRTLDAGAAGEARREVAAVRVQSVLRRFLAMRMATRVRWARQREQQQLGGNEMSLQWVCRVEVVAPHTGFRATAQLGQMEMAALGIRPDAWCRPDAFHRDHNCDGLDTAASYARMHWRHELFPRLLDRFALDMPIDVPAVGTSRATIHAALNEAGDAVEQLVPGLLPKERKLEQDRVRKRERAYARCVKRQQRKKEEEGHKTSPPVPSASPSTADMAQSDHSQPMFAAKDLSCKCRVDPTTWPFTWARAIASAFWALPHRHSVRLATLSGLRELLRDSVQCGFGFMHITGSSDQQLTARHTRGCESGHDEPRANSGEALNERQESKTRGALATAAAASGQDGDYADGHAPSRLQMQIPMGALELELWAAVSDSLGCRSLELIGALLFICDRRSEAPPPAKASRRQQRHRKPSEHNHTLKPISETKDADGRRYATLAQRCLVVMCLFAHVPAGGAAATDLSRIPTHCMLRRCDLEIMLEIVAAGILQLCGSGSLMLGAPKLKSAFAREAWSRIGDPDFGAAAKFSRHIFHQLSEHSHPESGEARISCVALIEWVQAHERNSSDWQGLACCPPSVFLARALSAVARSVKAVKRAKMKIKALLLFGGGVNAKAAGANALDSPKPLDIGSRRGFGAEDAPALGSATAGDGISPQALPAFAQKRRKSSLDEEHPRKSSIDGGAHPSSGGGRLMNAGNRDDEFAASVMQMTRDEFTKMKDSHLRHEAEFRRFDARDRRRAAAERATGMKPRTKFPNPRARKMATSSRNGSAANQAAINFREPADPLAVEWATRRALQMTHWRDTVSPMALLFVTKGYSDTSHGQRSWLVSRKAGETKKAVDPRCIATWETRHIRAVFAALLRASARGGGAEGGGGVTWRCNVSDDNNLAAGLTVTRAVFDSALTRAFAQTYLEGGQSAKAQQSTILRQMTEGVVLQNQGGKLLPKPSAAGAIWEALTPSFTALMRDRVKPLWKRWRDLEWDADHFAAPGPRVSNIPVEQGADASAAIRAEDEMERKAAAGAEAVLDRCAGVSNDRHRTSRVLVPEIVAAITLLANATVTDKADALFDSCTLRQDSLTDPASGEQVVERRLALSEVAMMHVTLLRASDGVLGPDISDAPEVGRAEQPMAATRASPTPWLEDGSVSLEQQVRGRMQFEEMVGSEAERTTALAFAEKQEALQSEALSLALDAFAFNGIRGPAVKAVTAAASAASATADIASEAALAAATDEHAAEGSSDRERAPKPVGLYVSSTLSQLEVAALADSATFDGCDDAVGHAIKGECNGDSLVRLQDFTLTSKQWAAWAASVSQKIANAAAAEVKKNDKAQRKAAKAAAAEQADGAAGGAAEASMVDDDDDGGGGDDDESVMSESPSRAASAVSSAAEPSPIAALPCEPHKLFHCYMCKAAREEEQKAEEEAASGFSKAEEQSRCLELVEQARRAHARVVTKDRMRVQDATLARVQHEARTSKLCVGLPKKLDRTKSQHHMAATKAQKSAEAAKVRADDGARADTLGPPKAMSVADRKAAAEAAAMSAATAAVKAQAAKEEGAETGMERLARIRAQRAQRLTVKSEKELLERKAEETEGALKAAKKRRHSRRKSSMAIPAAVKETVKGVLDYIVEKVHPLAPLSIRILCLG